MSARVFKSALIHQQLSQRQYKRTSDQAHLVYCNGAMDFDAYLLIIILKPEAHKMARDNNYMHKIGMMAESFRMVH